MRDEQLAEIAARLRAATLVAPKPWSVDQPREDDFARDVKDRDGTEICAMENNYSEDDETIAVFIANAPADIAALIAAYKDATRERDKVRMLFESKDASLVAIARERDEARAQLEAVTRELDAMAHRIEAYERGMSK